MTRRFFYWLLFLYVTAIVVMALFSTCILQRVDQKNQEHAEEAASSILESLHQ